MSRPEAVVGGHDPGGHDPGGMAAVMLVISREVRERLRTKAYRWSTVMLLVAVVAGVAVPKLLGGDETSRAVRVGATAAVPADVRRVVSQIDARATGGGSNNSDDAGGTVVVTYASERRGRQAVVDGSVAFLITPERLFVGKKVADNDSGSEAQVFAATSELLRLQAGLEQVGVAGSDAIRALSTRPLPVERLADKKDSRHEDQIPLVGIANVFMYLILIFYGQAVAGGVNEEKSSRVVELLLSALTPRRLLTGKVIGIGLVGLLQVALMAAAAGVTALIVGVDLPSGSPGTGAAYVVWFVLAYSLYCTLFAAAGSLTSRPEEAQQSATPVFIVLAIGYLAAFAALESPNGALVTVLSFIPFSAPMVMPARAAIGSVPLIAVGASMLLTVAAIVVVNWLAGRIYAGALLRFGPRVKLREAYGTEDRGRNRPVQPPDSEDREPVATGSSRQE